VELLRTFLGQDNKHADIFICPFARFTSRSRQLLEPQWLGHAAYSKRQ
jgi:hypothetical protein